MDKITAEASDRKIGLCLAWSSVLFFAIGFVFVLDRCLIGWSNMIISILDWISRELAKFLDFFAPVITVVGLVAFIISEKKFKKILKEEADEEALRRKRGRPRKFPPLRP